MDNIDSSKKARPSLFESFNIQDCDSSGGKASPTPLKQINWEKFSLLTKATSRNGDMTNAKSRAENADKETIVIDDDVSENSNSGNTPASIPTPNIVQSVKVVNQSSDGRKKNAVHNQDSVPQGKAESQPRSDAAVSTSSSNHDSSTSFSKSRKLTQGKIDGYFHKSPPPEKGFRDAARSSDRTNLMQNGQGNSCDRKSEVTEKAKAEKTPHKDRSHSHSSSKRHHSENSSKSSSEKHSSSKQGQHRHTKSASSSSSSHSHADKNKKPEGQDLRTFNMFEVTTMSLARRIKTGQVDLGNVSSDIKTEASSSGSKKTHKEKPAVQKKSESKTVEKTDKDSKPHDKDNHRSSHVKVSSKSHRKSSEGNSKTPEKIRHSSKSSKRGETPPAVVKTPSKQVAGGKKVEDGKDIQSVESDSRHRSHRKESNSATKIHVQSSERKSTGKAPEKIRHSSKSSGNSGSLLCTEKTPSKTKAHSEKDGKSPEKHPMQKQPTSGEKDDKRNRGSSSGGVVTPEMIFQQVYGVERTPQKECAPHSVEKTPQNVSTPQAAERTPLKVSAPHSVEKTPQKVSTPQAFERTPQKVCAHIVEKTPQKVSNPQAFQRTSPKVDAPQSVENTPQKVSTPLAFERTPQKVYAPHSVERTPQKVCTPQVVERTYQKVCSSHGVETTPQKVTHKPFAKTQNQSKSNEQFPQTPIKDNLPNLPKKVYENWTNDYWTPKETHNTDKDDGSELSEQISGDKLAKYPESEKFTDDFPHKKDGLKKTPSSSKLHKRKSVESDAKMSQDILNMLIGQTESESEKVAEVPSRKDTKVQLETEEVTKKMCELSKPVERKSVLAVIADVIKENEVAAARESDPVPLLNMLDNSSEKKVMGDSAAVSQPVLELSNDNSGGDVKNSKTLGSELAVLAPGDATLGAAPVLEAIPASPKGGEDATASADIMPVLTEMNMAPPNRLDNELVKSSSVGSIGSDEDKVERENNSLKSEKDGKCKIIPETESSKYSDEKNEVVESSAVITAVSDTRSIDQEADGQSVRSCKSGVDTGVETSAPGCVPVEPDSVSLGGSSVFDDATSGSVRMDDGTEMDYEAYLTMISDPSEIEKDDKSSVSGLSIRTTTSADVLFTPKGGYKTCTKVFPARKDDIGDFIDEKEAVSIRSESPESCGDVEKDEEADDAQSDAAAAGGTEGAVSLGQVILVDDDTIPFGDDEEEVGQTCELITSFSSLNDLGVNKDGDFLHLHLSSEESSNSATGNFEVSGMVENISLVRVGSSPERYTVSSDTYKLDTDDAGSQSLGSGSKVVAGFEGEAACDKVLDEDRLNSSSESIIVKCVIEGNEIKASVEDVDMLCLKENEGKMHLVEEKEKSVVGDAMTADEESRSSSLVPAEGSDVSGVLVEDYDGESVDDLLTEIDNVLKNDKQKEVVDSQTVSQSPVLVGDFSNQSVSDQLSEVSQKSSDEKKSIQSDVSHVSSAASEQLAAQNGSSKEPCLPRTDITTTSDLPGHALPELSSHSPKLLDAPPPSEPDSRELTLDRQKASEIPKRAESVEEPAESSEEEEEITPRQTRSRTRTSDSQSEFSPPPPRTLKLKQSFKAGNGGKLAAPGRTEQKEIIGTRTVEKDSGKNLPSAGEQTNSASDTGESVRKSSRKRKIKSLGDDIIVFAEAGAMKSGFYTKTYEKKATDVESSGTSDKGQGGSKPAKATLETEKRGRPKKIRTPSVNEKESSEEHDRTLRSTSKTQMNLAARALRSGNVSSPEKSSVQKSIRLVKPVGGKELFSKKLSSSDAKVLRRVSSGDEKKRHTVSCSDDDQKRKPLAPNLKSDARKRNRSEEQSPKKLKEAVVTVKRGRGRPRKGEVVQKAVPVKKAKTDDKKPEEVDSSDDSEENEREDTDDDDDYDDGGEVESSEDFTESNDTESEASSSDSDSSPDRRGKKRFGKYSYKRDDDYRPANVSVEAGRRGRTRKRAFLQSDDSDRDSSEECQNNSHRCFGQQFKVLSPAAKVPRTAKKSDALTAAEAAAAKRRAEKEQIKNRHRNLVKKAISTQNHQKLKMKPFKRKTARAILVGERKRLERGAKSRVTMYYSDGMEDIKSDESDEKSSSSSEEDYIKDIYKLFGTPDADSTQGDKDQLDLDSDLIQNPLNIPYYPELREAALNGEQNNNCLLVFNDDTHWNDVAEEMPSKCSTICAKFTGAIVTSIEYQFRDDECSGCESDEPEAKRTRRSVRKDTTQSPSKLRLKKKAAMQETKNDKSSVKSSLSPRKESMSSQNKHYKSHPKQTSPIKTAVVRLDNINTVEKRSPVKVDDVVPTNAESPANIPECVKKFSAAGESSKQTLANDSAVIVIDSDNSQSPKKKDLMKDRKGVLGLYEEFMSMLHAEKPPEEGSGHPRSECGKSKENEISSTSIPTGKVHQRKEGDATSGCHKLSISLKSEIPRMLFKGCLRASAVDVDEVQNMTPVTVAELMDCDDNEGSENVSKHGKCTNKEETRDTAAETNASDMSGRREKEAELACDKPSTSTSNDKSGDRVVTPELVTSEKTAAANCDKDENDGQLPKSRNLSPEPDPSSSVSPVGSETVYILVDCDGDYVLDEMQLVPTAEGNLAFQEGSSSVVTVDEAPSVPDPEIERLARVVDLDHNYSKKMTSDHDQVWIRVEDYESGVFDAAVKLEDIGPLLSFSDEVGTFVDNESRLTIDAKEKIKPKQDEPDTDGNRP